MKELYKGKYKGITLRAQWWDYRRAAGYFITFNVQGRHCCFGEVHKGKMRLSAAGEIAEALWKEIPERFPYLELGAFVVMPDHIHGILIQKDSSGCAINRAPKPTIEEPTIEESTVEQESKTGGALGHHNPMLHETISKAIRWFKGRTTYEVRKMKIDFNWQSRYYDRIIRNQEEYERIRNYILKNPGNWGR